MVEFAGASPVMICTIAGTSTADHSAGVYIAQKREEGRTTHYLQPAQVRLGLCLDYNPSQQSMQSGTRERLRQDNVRSSRRRGRTACDCVRWDSSQWTGSDNIHNECGMRH